MTTFFSGAVRVDITPPNPTATYIAGFKPSRRATGVAKPLHASALFLSRGTEELVVVSADVIGFPRALVQRVRRAVPEMVGSSIILCATHTHAGPDTVGLWGWGPFGLVPLKSGSHPEYEEFLVATLAGAIRSARAAAQPSRLRAAEIDVPQQWSRNDRKGGARFDHGLVMALESTDGDPIAFVFNYACHPEVLWFDNTDLSPDYPGYFCDEVIRRGAGVPVFLSGPLGGMLAPNVDLQATLDERRAHCERMGTELANVALDGLEGTMPKADVALEHRSTEVDVSNQNVRFSFFSALGLVPDVFHEGTHRTEAHMIRVGPVQILTAPGEPVPEVGLKARDLQTGKFRGQVGLCCDMLGYIMDPEMFDDAEYKYEVTMSLGPLTRDALFSGYASLITSG